MSFRVLFLLPFFCFFSGKAASSVISKSAPLRYLVPSEEPASDWIQPSFNDSTWTLGTNGFGYDLDIRTYGITNLSGHWSFNDQLDMGKDSSPNLNNLIHNGVLLNAGGVKNGAAEFHGSAQFVFPGVFPINMPTGNIPYTISVWIKPDALAAETAGGLMGILGYGTHVTPMREGNFLRMGGTVHAPLAKNTFNQIHNYWWGGPAGGDIVREGAQAGVNFTDGKWHHVLVTYNQSQKVLYANGNPMGAPAPANSANMQPVNFKIGNSIEGDRYSGLMDEVVIYKEALAPNQVKALAEGADPTKLPERNHVPYKDHLRTDVTATMHTKQSTAYLRIPFTIDSIYTPDVFSFKVLYDDAFVAYLNGTEIFRNNAPTPAFYNSTAAERTDSQSTTLEEINLQEFASLLVKGNNLLAIHLINNSKDSTDLLFEGEVVHEVRDSDLDGLPDSWENLYSLDTNDPATGSQDPDGDGLTNEQEFAAGSDPTVPDFTINTLTLRIQKMEGEVKLSFDASAQKTYSILFNNSLNGDSSWVALKSFEAPPTAQELTHSDPLGSSRFYRVVTPAVTDPPPTP